MDISKYDSIDITTPPIEISGFRWREPGGPFIRLPQEFLSSGAASEGLLRHAPETAGGMIRFRTDSTAIGAEVWLTGVNRMVDMANSGSSEIDLYADSKYFRSIFPGDDAHYSGVFDSVYGLDGSMRQWTINMPLYAGVVKMNILLKSGAVLLPPLPFSVKKPVLCYGSSITQGCSASRPGNCYTAILARRLNAELVNLGFSGNAMGEIEMAEMISTLDLSAFIMDYDHNAPNDAHLIQTHRPFFAHIRAKWPELPVLFISKPDFDNNPRSNGRRRDIIRKTYTDAVNAGDRNVYFIDGETLFDGAERDACTMDGCHPNDIGFMRIADTIMPVLRRALES